MDTQLLDLRHRLDRLRSDLQGELKSLQQENQDLKVRVQALAQLLVSKRVISAEELSALLAAKLSEQAAAPTISDAPL